jgi:hypothetical protein
MSVCSSYARCASHTTLQDEASDTCCAVVCIPCCYIQALLQYTIASSATAKAASQPDGQQQQQQLQQDSAAALFQQLHTGEGFDAEQVGMTHMQTAVFTYICVW